MKNRPASGLERFTSVNRVCWGRMNHTSVNPDMIDKLVPGWIIQPAVLVSSVTPGTEVRCLTGRCSSARLPSYHFKISLLSPCQECKKPKMLTHWHCVFHVWRIFCISWPALMLLSFPLRLWWKTFLPQQSFPALWPNPLVFGTPQATACRDECWRWHCSAQLAPPVSISSALHHALQQRRLTPYLHWSLAEEALAQENRVRHFLPEQWKRQKFNREEDKKCLKSKVPRTSSSVITSVLTPGLVLGDYPAPWAGFLQNLSCWGGASLVEILLGVEGI